jgi:hypothetical protein
MIIYNSEASLHTGFFQKQLLNILLLIGCNFTVAAVIA